MTGSDEGMLFDGEDRQKQSRVDAVADEIKERFGTGALRRGSSLRGESPRRCSVDSERPRKSTARAAVAEMRLPTLTKGSS